MIRHYISEQGRILKHDTKKREILVLTKDSNNQSQWLAIELGERETDKVQFPIINNSHFQELDKLVLSTSDHSGNYFISKSSEKIFLLSTEWFPELPEVNFPTDFDNKDELTKLLADKKTLCKAAAYVHREASTVSIRGQQQELSQLPLQSGQFFDTINRDDKKNRKTIYWSIFSKKR